MSDGVSIVVASITALASITAAVLSFVANRRLMVFHMQVNSRMDQLLSSEIGRAHAEGIIVGQDKGIRTEPSSGSNE